MKHYINVLALSFLVLSCLAPDAFSEDEPSCSSFLCQTCGTELFPMDFLPKKRQQNCMPSTTGHLVMGCQIAVILKSPVFSIWELKR